MKCSSFVRRSSVAKSYEMVNELKRITRDIRRVRKGNRLAQITETIHDDDDNGDDNDKL
ncbi:hypothetical protein PGB90_005270 [Kerria lacca]